MKDKSYSGRLAQPIVLPDHWARDRLINGRKAPQIYSAAAKRQDDRERKQAEAERFDLLFEHFGLDASAKHAWRDLALALARRHVPGFSTTRARGAPVTSDVGLLFRLFNYARRKRQLIAVTQKKNPRKISQNHVADALIKDACFQREFSKRFLSRKTLVNLLSKAAKQRRANILHRWKERATLRRFTEIERDTLLPTGDPPFWPTHRPWPKEPSR